jgi:cytochrome c oxidase subunit 2
VRLVRPRGGAAAGVATLALAAAACAGPLSTLDTAGTGAERIADLWWMMAAGAAGVWVVVVGLAVYAIRVSPGPHDARTTRRLIIGGGTVFPAVVLAGLVVRALGLMPGLLAPGADGLEVRVSGEEWWWRVEYRTEAGDAIQLANEVRLPVGRRTELTLSSPDVIHSFWIPSLGGKIDMIPGRTTRLALEPTRTGTFRGVCAEFCGTSHAWMAFTAVVMEPDAFEAWLAGQAAPAQAVGTTAGRLGLDAFLANGCGACHTVRGTTAGGVIGPDLTHVGGREMLAGGVVANDLEGLRDWITAPTQYKPSAHMPAFSMLPEEDIRAIAVWLDGLR